MKVYLASKFENNAQMRDVRDKLEIIGYTITSRWIDLHPDVVGISPLADTEALQIDPRAHSILAEHDITDLLAADIFIHFTPEDHGGRGGRHVEFGIAFACGKRMILVGKREHVFHTLSEVEHFGTAIDMIRQLTKEMESR